MERAGHQLAIPEITVVCRIFCYIVSKIITDMETPFSVMMI